jgi:hypothetical protein
MRRAPLRRTAQRIRTARIPSTWGVPFCLVDAPVRRACVRLVGRMLRMLPEPHRDKAHLSQACTDAGLTVRTSAPGLGSPQPHRHRGWGHRVHRTGRNETSAPPGCAAPIALPCNVSGLGRVCLAPCLGCNVSGLQPCLGCDGRCDPVRRLQRCAAGTNARTNGSSRSCVRARTSSRRRRVALVPPGLPRWGVVRDRCAAFRRPYPSGLTGPRDLRRRRLPTSSTSA